MEHFWYQFVHFVKHRTTGYVASWLLCAGIVCLQIYYGWDAFLDNRRPAEQFLFWELQGNSGHCTIDFGGQWLMGAMLVQGHGQELYNRYYQRELLEAAYPIEDEAPESERNNDEKGKHDAGELMGWTMGTDDKRQGAQTIGSLAAPLAAGNGLEEITLLAAGTLPTAKDGKEEWTKDKLRGAVWPVGGPLYPPINALYFAPLGAVRPRLAYRINQVLCIIWALGAGLGMSYLCNRPHALGRFWWPLAASLVLIYPGFKGAFHLGQNAPLTLFILVWGWALLVRGHPVAGGLVWGLLAFKPVWALAFFLVPLITGRFRFCIAMLIMGIALVLATLPFVGIHSWFDWLHVGKDAAKLYNTDQNWVFLSRDLLGIPRRWMLDFSVPSWERDRPAAALVGWALWAAVLEICLLLTALRWKQARALTGPAPAFLLLTAWMMCFHFMYYDVLLTLLAFFLLCTGPAEFLKPIFLAVMPLPRDRLPADLAAYYDPQLPREYPSELPLLRPEHRHVLVLNRLVPTILVVLLIVEHLFLTMGVGISVTGWWTEDKPFPVTIHWEGVGGHVTTAAHWTPHPFRLSSSPYVDGQPWDTYVFMFLWLWCAGLWLRMGQRPAVRELPQPAVMADVTLVPAEEPAPPHAIRPA